MLRVLQNDLADPDHFTVTLELVPGRESTGRAVDTIIGIARDAFTDGRVSAVSITDNPGGNPALSPDVIGHDIFHIGMDVIVHFTCRDMNRVGIESRALQLAMMGMKNILALTGDYSGTGFGGQGAPVFDLDSVQLQILIGMLTERMAASGDPDGFFAGCAVSPFKYTEGECFAQYAKLCRKAAAGAQFIITQLGYDWYKYYEMIRMMNYLALNIPVLGSVYLLTPRVARIMNEGQVPGAVVPNNLRKKVESQWTDIAEGRKAAIERTARLAAVLKGLGYGGIHIGGIHRDFDSAGFILDRLEAIGDQWRDFIDDFTFPETGAYYAFGRPGGQTLDEPRFGKRPVDNGAVDQFRFSLLKLLHHQFFNKEHLLASRYRRISRCLEGRWPGSLLTRLIEHPSKTVMLGCAMCGDCAIEHVGFLCPESQCPKHIRNGACGGSQAGRCEVFPKRFCVWYRAYRRLANSGETSQMIEGCIPPRMWELNQTSSWINFHLDRDHQGVSTEITLRCRMAECRM